MCPLCVLHHPWLACSLAGWQVGKSSANRASKAANKKAATAAAEEGSAALQAVFAKGAKSIEDLKKVGQEGGW